MKTLFTSILIALVSVTITDAKIVAKVEYKNKIYCADVLGSSSNATVWLRVRENACSAEDIKILNMKSQKTTMKQAKRAICRGIKIYNNSKTIAGCLSVALSGACAVGTVATDGAAAFMCTTLWTYAAEKGAANCISGIADKIAGYLAKDSWAPFAAKVGIGGADLKDAIDVAINRVCNDVK